MVERSIHTAKAPPVLVPGGASLAFPATDRKPRACRRQVGCGYGATLESWFKAHLARLAAGDYVAMLAYLDAAPARLAALQGLRGQIRDRTKTATCLQFGPRFLHSTGQLYKGGPNSGVFLQITAAAHPDLAIPGREVSFGIVEAAQAGGDYRVLGERGRRLLRVHLTAGIDVGLAAIAKAMQRTLQ